MRTPSIDPLSPLLFTIFFMIVIREMQAEQETQGVKPIFPGITVKGGIRHYLKAFADDLTIIARDKERMLLAWARMQAAFRWCGLAENAKNVVTWSSQRSHREVTVNHIEVNLPWM